MNGGTSVIEKNYNVEELLRQKGEKKDYVSDRDHEAISLFEKAVDRESHGLMSDAVEFYRRAYKINEQVDLLYRTQKLPHAVKRLQEEGGKNITKKVDEEKVKAIDVDKLLQSFAYAEVTAPDENSIDPQDSLVIKFANLGSNSQEKDLTVTEISPLMSLPSEVWNKILEHLIVMEPDSWFNFSITCKRNAYLGFGSSQLWQKLCYLVYPNQIYYENLVCMQNRTPSEPLINSDSLPVPLDQLVVLSQYKNSWKYMLRHRPFIKFGGCYISVVNYYSEGGKTEFSDSWSNPVRTITYYRYLRFYPDGTCVKVLSSLEPNKVVPYLLKLNTLRSLQHLDSTDLENGNNSSHIKESHKIYHGRWCLTTLGEVHIEINEGSVPYYDFYYRFEIKSLGGIFIHSKLTWIKYFAIRKKLPGESHQDERVGEEINFSLKNEKPFKFLKVRSYRTDN
ncbi:uncharacterized protein PRCAT00001289001 [Priceomyces carsonii]|uniref:uncharacterized protein n=1 Tax=Priceomyces carsonii TaxID=28549 RepID=UPI002ED9D97A|nr:unnamed protein product [Priceomyces carsonii]